MREIKRDIVAGVIISKDNKILFGKGREGSVYQDTCQAPTSCNTLSLLRSGSCVRLAA
jgi:hypothetical protein